MWLISTKTGKAFFFFLVNHGIAFLHPQICTVQAIKDFISWLCGGLFLMFIKILYKFKATPKLLFIVVDYLQIQSQVSVVF